ncbi:hypothetical protein MRB53_030544 [Persea americana]|uniref:Uncharacterized protein n=1 Tax=Persea americana TaxID=3435 RepID=A0ACC2KLY7_PERAE|nr:hypothetical protein MRB53_030544 [Persea americana]
MSTVSANRFSGYLVPNIAILVSIKLENHNYLLWCSQFLPVLRAHGLIGFVDGSNVCPDEFVTSRAVWLALERCFASLSRSHIIQLKSQLQTIKKGSLSIDEYVKKIKHIVDSLAAVCSPVDDEDIIIYTLNGLPPEYGPFRTSIRTRSAPILLEELHVLLQCEELNLDITQTSSTDILTTAMVASKEANKSGTPLNNRGGKSNFHGRGRGPKNNNRGRGNPIQPSNPKPCCQICNRTGHTALDCYHRMDYSYQGRHPPSQLAAMAASFNQNND